MARLLIILLLLLMLGAAIYAAAFGWTVSDILEFRHYGRLAFWLGALAAVVILPVLLALVLTGQGGRSDGP